jgi:hypothetical protein
MPKIIDAGPPVVWELGDSEQVTVGPGAGVTRTVRPLYYRAPGETEARRAGAIHPDYAERLMDALTPK